MSLQYIQSIISKINSNYQPVLIFMQVYIYFLFRNRKYLQIATKPARLTGFVAIFPLLFMVVNATQIIHRCICNVEQLFANTSYSYLGECYQR